MKIQGIKKGSLLRSLINYIISAPKINYPFRNGILIKMSAEKCNIEDGQPVITIDGDVGIIVKFYGSIFKPGREKWIDVKLDNKTYKHVYVSNIFVMFVYLPLSNQYHPLSHQCYRYLKPEDTYTVIPFRFTKRGYAMLSNDFKSEREYLAILRRTKQGSALLEKIEQSNYIIIKNN
jgi:hypothetical protein